MNSIPKIIELIQKMMSENFWGEVVIKFKNGRPVIMTTTTQTKLD
tara:strand:+ start:1986 stop:2120 length:135 start_codon:yes stop_codon:yes gene_type:complete